MCFDLFSKDRKTFDKLFVKGDSRQELPLHALSAVALNRDSDIEDITVKLEGRGSDV